MITQDLGIATAYGYAKSKGYTGTEAEFAELMASYASTAQTAIEAADRAVEANTAAQSAKTSAQSSASTASTAAQTATSKASEAVTAAGTATTKALEASTSAQSANQSAGSASTSAQTATTAASTATTKASEAAASKAAALSAKTDAETARDAAAQSASEAAASAESIDPETLEHKIYAAFATDTATGSIASFPDGADNIPMKDVLVHIEPVQEGSGDPSPDNVRPITGWTGVQVTRTGKNLLSLDDTTFVQFFETEIAEIPAGTYVYSAIITSTDTDADTCVIVFLDVDKNTIASKSISRSVNNARVSTNSFTNSVPIKYVRLYSSSGFPSGVEDTATFKDNMIESGSTATDYEPYSGQTYDIAFPTEAGTVYGGTLDVTTGELVMDRAIIASYAGEILPSTWISDRDVYSEGATPTTGAQVCYELATPITYQLTPQEITSLLGENNIWANTGNSDVEYRADAKLYITKKITEAVSALS